jgi:hypothetical protein
MAARAWSHFFLWMASCAVLRYLPTAVPTFWSAAMAVTGTSDTAVAINTLDAAIAALSTKLAFLIGRLTGERRLPSQEKSCRDSSPRQPH